MAVNLCIFVLIWFSIEGTCYLLHQKIKPSSNIIKDDLFTILDGGEYEKDENLLFKLKPNVSFFWEYETKHKTGAEGWRIGDSRNDRRVINTDTLRIIVVGDSCTFGLGVPYYKTYGAILEKMINEQTPQMVKVYNYGVPGFTSFQCKKLLEKAIPSLTPYAVVCYIGANDGAPAMEYSDKEYYESINASNKFFVYRLLKYSNVYKLLQARRHKKLLAAIKEAVNQLPQDVDWFSLGLPDLLEELRHRGIVISTNVFNKKRVSTEEFSENLMSVKRLAQRHNAIFIYIPNIWNDGEGLYYREDYLIGDYLDVIEEMRKYRIEDVYIDTVHPSPKGHYIIAKVLFDRLFKNDLD